MKDKILVLLSGGVDSTGLLYKCLNDSKYSHLDVHVHHVNIITRLKKHIPEAIACKNIVEWLREKNYSFEYTESTVDLSSVFKDRVPWDTEICWSIAAMICQIDSSIKWASTGRKLDDSGPAEEEETRKRLDTLFHYMTSSEWRNYEGVKNLPVIAHMTKKEIWNYLPVELREMTWYCSVPLYNGDEIKACGLCHTCCDMKKIL